MSEISLLIEGMVLCALRQRVGPLWEVRAAEWRWMERVKHWKYV